MNKGRLAGIIAGASVLLALSACTRITPLADEDPYKNMIGQCYTLQQDMRIRENSCWELGEAILSPDESTFCFKGTLDNVKKGEAIRVVDVRRQRFGETGWCPQIQVSIEGSTVAAGIFLPLCHTKKQLSWLEQPLWQRGDSLLLRSQYVTSCGTK